MLGGHLVGTPLGNNPVRLLNLNDDSVSHPDLVPWERVSG